MMILAVEITENEFVRLMKIEGGRVKSMCGEIGWDQGLLNDILVWANPLVESIFDF